MSNNITQVFTDIYHDNFWKDRDSRSGPGSNMEQTEAIRREIPKLLSRLFVHYLLDIPCGDYYWWKEMNLSGIDYTGADIVSEIIENNQANYPDVKFEVLNIINDDLPIVDLIFCRDCLGHLSTYNICRAINNMRSSGSTYLLATHFTDPKWLPVTDIKDGAWRPLNLTSSVFGLGQPLFIINERLVKKNGEFKDKCLGLWELQ